MATDAPTKPPDRTSDPQRSHAEVTCAHCGLPVPKGLLKPDADTGSAAGNQFCCRGCETVYAVIHQMGLGSYYRLKARQGAETQPARTTGAGYTAFDHEAFTQRCCEDRPDGLRCTTFYLEGVHCAACLWLVEKLPAVVPGVVEARLNMHKSLVRLTWDPKRVDLSKIAAALDSLGYPPHPARDVAAGAVVTAENRRELVRIGVAGAAVGNAMILAVCLYAGMFTGIEERYETLFRWVGMGIAGVSLAWPGSVFFRGAWSAIRTRTPHMDLPIALGLAAGGVAGAVNTALGRGEVYFDTLTVLVFLLLVGRAIQRRQQRRAADAVEQLFRLTPVSARRVEGGAVSEVPIEALNVGDTVELRAGESVPVDGQVIEGTSEADQSLLTGESRPVAVAVGDPVLAGSVNLSSTLRVRVGTTGERTRVGALMRLVEESTRDKAPAVQAADRLAGWFVVTVFTLAVLTFAFWLWRDPVHAADHAVALLIVACPCALGLATPLTLAVAIGRAARRGILIKGGAALERMARRGTILLDKTGTVTLGRTTLVRWFGDEAIKPLAATVEAHSSHRIARAMTEALEASAIDAEVCDVTQTHTGGISARVAGQFVQIGSADCVGRSLGGVPDWAQNHVAQLTGESLTPVLIAVDGEVRAVAGFGDALRPDAGRAVEALRRLGWRIGMVSGDHPRVVQHVAKELGLSPDDTHGGVMPEKKVELVRRYSEGGPVVMVGDGVNDAAALAAATVGIAVHGGAEASLAAADIYLSRPGLSPIIGLNRASRQVIRGIRRGMVVSLAYNTLGVSLAAAGVINPLIAAVLMPVSSLTVLALAVGNRAFVSVGADEGAKP
jgi:P-type Cu2+ transporter